MIYTNDDQLNKFRRIGDLSMFKFREYLPAMILTNLSTLLLITVDGLVVGNFTGADALAAVSVFMPLTVFFGAFAALAAYGIGTSLSTSIGSNKGTEIKKIKGVSYRLMIIMAVIAAFIQIPIVWALLKAYRLPDAIYALAWQYAIGIMFSMPLGIISAVGTNMLQISGKMKILTKLTVLEGTVNLVLDLLFVGPLHMGVAGAGFGTACANLVRCSATMISLWRYTDMLRYRDYRGSISEYINILRLGVPDAAACLMNAVQGYFVMQILLSAFGESAGTINGICVFCYSLVNVLITGILGAMRPLVGLLTGADDREGIRFLIKQAALFMIIMIGTAVAVIELFPGIFYRIHGIADIPLGGKASVRIYALFFMPYAFSGFYRLLLVNKKDSRYTARITLIGNCTQPFFALGLMMILSAPWVYLSESLTSVLMLVLYMRRYQHLNDMDTEEAENSNDLVLYMSVRKQEAVEASRTIRRFAEEQGIDPRITYRIALCMEEMVAYIEAVNEKDIPAQIIVRFKVDGGATFVILDNGKCIALQKQEDQEMGLTTDNYVLMQRLAKNAEYQYVQGMNYTILEFA